jgi:glucose-6-phosphate 1-dehydrogenase
MLTLKHGGTVGSMTEAQNPFADPLRFERRVPECAIVIFGANGDLTKRKLLPALYQLAADRRLPASFAVIGTSRTTLDDQAFRSKMRDDVRQFLEGGSFDADLWDRFSANLHYVAGDMNDPVLYRAIRDKLAEIGQHNVLFYLSRSLAQDRGGKAFWPRPG